MHPLPLRQNDNGPLFRGKRGFNRFRHFLGFRGSLGIKALDDLAILADEELVEVPLDVTGERRIFAREYLVERVAVRAVDLDLVEQRESHAVLAGAELLDLLIRARFLGAELVAGETGDDQTFILILLVSGFEALVLGSITALGGDVDHEDDLAFIIFQGGILAIDVLQRDIVNRLGGRGRERSSHSHDSDKRTEFHAQKCRAKRAAVKWDSRGLNQLMSNSRGG